MRVFAFILCALFACNVKGYAQSSASGAGNITSRLEAFYSSHVMEKAYLHTDKPYYAAGDTLWFKAYVTIGEDHKPTPLSRVLHADLVNPDLSIHHSIRLEIANGLAWGSIILPDTLPAGNYRIRAYTQWMKNEGEAAFFDKVIPIGSVNEHHPVAKTAVVNTPVSANQPVTQFFPEGGVLIAGIRTKTAFKAVAANGKGIAVKGIIKDDLNNEIKRFESAHLGMGALVFIPAEGRTYKALLTYADGSKNTVKLPVVQQSGITLIVNNNLKDKLNILVAANQNYYKENKGQSFFITIKSGGIIKTYSSKLDVPQLDINLLKNQLSSGIAQITLLSAKQEPLAERLAFIQSADIINIHLQTSQPSYQPRQQVQLNIKSTNAVSQPDSGHLSIAVIDETRVPFQENDETTLLTYQLLTSELKGYIEEPNYYFIQNSADSEANLDLLMLTQGYRKFTWKSIMNAEAMPVKWKAERTLSIQGLATRLNGKPLIKGTINLVPTGQGPLLTTQTDSSGRYSFSNLIFYDTTRFVLNAINEKGKNSTKIIYQAAKNEPVQTSYLTGAETADYTMQTYLSHVRNAAIVAGDYEKIKGRLLQEIQIKAKRPEYNYRSSNLGGPGYADQVIHAKDLVNSTLLGDALQGIVKGVEFRRGNNPAGGAPYLRGFNTGPMQIVLDGAIMPAIDVSDNGRTTGFSLNALNINDIETIEILKFSNASIYGMNAGNGVIVITTKTGAEPNSRSSSAVGLLPIAVDGFYKGREFYAPQYTVSNTQLQTGKDLRTTIFWKPEITTNSNGEASLSYYNADTPGNYKIIVEGMDNNGRLGRQVIKYKVEQ